MQPFPNLRIAGLMTIGPFLPTPEGSVPMFRLLASCATYRGRSPGQRHDAPPVHGHDRDFEVAIEEGATIIRIGTAILRAPGAPPREREPVMKLTPLDVKRQEFKRVIRGYAHRRGRHLHGYDRRRA